MSGRSSRESNSRLNIDKLLIESNWKMPYPDEPSPNVDTEFPNKGGKADYLLINSKGFPLCIIEAKNNLKSPLVGKEQARSYAETLNCRFVILSNGINHYLWDLKQGNPYVIDRFPSQEQLEARTDSFNPSRKKSEEINNDYLVISQFKNYEKNPDYKNEDTRNDFIFKNNLRFLRYYQLEALLAVKNKVNEGQDRFLLEMATGTGKTNTAAGIIKLFLRLFNVKRVLFLVDRLELETQGRKELDDILKNDYQTVIWKENKDDWIKADIVVSTVQSFVSKNKYKKVFKPDDFDLVISDEAHRSLGARSRSVFEFFIGFKLGLTATPRDFLKSVDVNKLSMESPKDLERRYMLDTYTIFGCEDGEPTYRYTLADGVKDGFLVNPNVIKVDTGLTADLMSKDGLMFKGVDEDGNDLEEQQFFKKDYEKKFKSKETNYSFCEAFVKNALKDPYTNEIGKTLIFCVSQNHATKITEILNEIVEKMFPAQYQSDFAVQVTSEVEGAQQMTINFKKNTLNGSSALDELYKTSKTRVCVTVGMMTTGYDCTDILNICMMRPVFSPSEFIQMKGRGTRLCDFKNYWIDTNAIPEEVDPKKYDFYLFDYFQNYKYFEEDFDYDEVLKLPAITLEGGGERPNDPEVFNPSPDPIQSIEEVKIKKEGMRIDREFYNSFRDKLKSDTMLSSLVEEQKYQEAEEYLRNNILDKPDEYYTLDKLRKSLGLDRSLTPLEVLLYAYDHIKKIKTKEECIEEEFEKFDNKFNIDENNFDHAKKILETYIIDEKFRDIVESGKLSQLSVHTSYEDYTKLNSEIRNNIPKFVKEFVDMSRFTNVR